MNRRRFLQSSAALASTVVPSLASAAEPLRLRYLLSSALYGDMSLETILPEVAAARCVGLDIWGKPHGTQREELEQLGVDAFGKMLEKHDVTLSGMSRYPLGPFGLQPEMPILQQLGGDLLVVASRGPRNVEGQEAKKGIREFLEKMKPHADAAGEHGITIAIENHGNALLYSPDSMRYFAEFNDHPALGVAFAPHHLHDRIDAMPGLIRDLGPSNLPFIYFQEYGIGSKETVAKEIELQQLPGYGTLDYRPILSALREIGFTGYAEIFMHPTPRGIPMLEGASAITQAINRSRDHIEALLKEVNA